MNNRIMRCHLKLNDIGGSEINISIKRLYFHPLYSSKEKMERIKQKLLEFERLLKNKKENKTRSKEEWIGQEEREIKEKEERLKKEFEKGRKKEEQ